MPGTVPSCSVSPACSTMRGGRAHRVEEVGQHEAKIVSSAATSAEVGEHVGDVEVAERREVWASTVNVSGACCTPKMNATTVVTMMLMTSAAGTLRTNRTIVTSSPSRNTPSGCVFGKTKATGTGPVATGLLMIDPGIDEADEQDEEPDADADRTLQAERDGIHDRLAQADEHEQQDDEALEHDDAHRAGRA